MIRLLRPKTRKRLTDYGYRPTWRGWLDMQRYLTENGENEVWSRGFGEWGGKDPWWELDLWLNLWTWGLGAQADGIKGGPGSGSSYVEPHRRCLTFFVGPYSVTITRAVPA